MDTPAFDSSPDPDNPGWLNWQMTDPTRYNGTVLGKMLVRSEGDGKARLRMFPEHRHSNLRDAVHGGVTLGFIDVAMFGASRMFGLIEAGAAVTTRVPVVMAVLSNRALRIFLMPHHLKPNGVWWSNSPGRLETDRRRPLSGRSAV